MLILPPLKALCTSLKLSSKVDSCNGNTKKKNNNLWQAFWLFNVDSKPVTRFSPKLQSSFKVTATGLEPTTT